MQVSSAILFLVSLFSRVIIEKALSQITNMGGIFSAKSLKREQYRLPPGCGTSDPLFQNCSPSISVLFLVCFLVFYVVMPLNKNSFGTDITCN